MLQKLNLFILGVFTTISILGLSLFFNIYSTFFYKPVLIKSFNTKLHLLETTDFQKYNPIIKLSTQEGFFCSGFVIDDNFAITAGHCLDRNNSLLQDKIIINDDKGANTFVTADAVGVARRSDLGLIKGNFSRFKKLKVELYKFNFTEKGRYVACGFPYGQNVLACNEYVFKTNQGFGLVGTGYLVPGQSGGPVIDLDTNTAIALNTAVIDDGVVVSPLQGLSGVFNLE